MGARRRWALAAAIAALALAVDVWAEVNVPRLVRQRIPTARLGAAVPLKVLHLTDIHDKVFPAGEGALDGFVAEAQADLIVVTGDWLDANSQDPAAMWRLAERLVRANDHVYYVPGNHEHANPLQAPFEAGLRQRGVRILTNRHEVFRKGPFTINVAGVDDPFFHRDRLDQALAGLDPRRYTLLLAHAPDPADHLAGTPVDLMLVGHTHGGQIRLPGIGAVFAPGQPWFPRYDRGLFDLGHQRWMYICSGLGTSTVPIRFLTPSQLSLVTITPER